MVVLLGRGVAVRLVAIARPAQRRRRHRPARHRADRLPARRRLHEPVLAVVVVMLRDHIRRGTAHRLAGACRLILELTQHIVAQHLVKGDIPGTDLRHLRLQGVPTGPVAWREGHRSGRGRLPAAIVPQLRLDRLPLRVYQI